MAAWVKDAIGAWTACVRRPPRLALRSWPRTVQGEYARAPLDVQRGPAEHVRAALDLAAPRLARGEAIPSEAIERMATSPMPDAIYRLVGDLGWRYQAFKNGVTLAALHARPLDR